MSQFNAEFDAQKGYRYRCPICRMLLSRDSDVGRHMRERHPVPPTASEWRAYASTTRTTYGAVWSNTTTTPSTAPHVVDAVVQSPAAALDVAAVASTSRAGAAVQMAVESSPQHVQQPQQQQQHMTADIMSRGVKRHSPLRPEESGGDETPKKKPRKEEEEEYEFECQFCGRCFNDRALCGLHICNTHITQML